jgi:hypothetical protein
MRMMARRDFAGKGNIVENHAFSVAFGPAISRRS